MRVRFTLVLKIVLPYILLASLFLLIFLSEFRSGHTMVTWLSGTGLLATLLSCILHFVMFRRSIQQITKMMGQLTRGELPRFRASHDGGEWGDLEQSFEQHVSNLKKMAVFFRSMAKGNYKGSFEKLSENDELGEALISLNNHLIASQEEAELRRREEENRTWSAQGLAMFGSLFREVEDNLEKLSMVLMKELVQYTEADAGAMFIATDGEEGQGSIFVASGSYAFDREKFIDRTFMPGEGLIGRAALEREIVQVNDLPADYISIRSGLGESAPASLLLVPVLLDNQVLAVMELASLGKIPGHQVDFIRQLADAAATTLSKIKANLQTRKLFEQSREQAEALAAQEKESRQNMERLERTQEEFADLEAALRQEIENLRKGSS